MTIRQPHPNWRPAVASALVALVMATIALPGLGAFYAAPKTKGAPAQAPEPASPIPPPPPPPTNGERSEALKVLDGKEFHDPSNPDFANLQTPSTAMHGLPRDNQGFVDWMKALREGQITPRASIDGTAKMNTLDLDVLLKDTKEMPWVKFPHLSHTLWLDCSNCHPDPFVAKAGANDISMADIFRGKYCGRCHDRVAFVTFFSCFRCHSVPQGTMPATPARQ